ncbi:suppressor of fused homolog [Culicoides brevitarsis]|uniref:suppressor of fused homolog n=1 Tax=Culicoides brevitarsis TaxID=469753 RepID=UPI00307C5BF6
MDALKNKGKMPKGLEKLIETCNSIYPDQTNPIQATTILKYWLGGQDPLDYISMYSNTGTLTVPPHWHYISFGLSDLHGDNRVHMPETSGDPEPKSGMGFELTFRLLKTPNDGDKPPSWPANLLQDLARYVFQTGNRLCSGDNIPWGKCLNKALPPTTKIKHMLICNDPQMPRTETPFGWVDFLQIVGVCEEELEKASRSNGKSVLNLLRTDVSTGGEWLITDMQRTKTVFELFPEKLRQLEANLEAEGSDLAGVNAHFEFKELFKSELNVLEQNVANANNWDANSDINIKKEPQIGDITCPVEQFPSVPFRATSFNGLEIKLPPYAAKFLVLAIRDRVRHGRHFTFKDQKYALTFVSESVTGSNCSTNNPYVILGYWIQVLITEDLVNRMIDAFKCLESTSIELLKLPQVFEFSDKNLKFIVDNFQMQQNMNPLLQ